MKLNTIVIRNTANKAILKARKHGPEIGLVFGVAGVVGSAIMACVATAKVVRIAEDSKYEKELLDIMKEDGDITEEEHKEQVNKLYIHTGIQTVKLYLPAVGLGVVSLASIISSHVVLKKRNASLGAAYIALDQGFKEYQKRVEERFGEDVEKEIRYGVKSEEVTEKTVSKNGKEKETKKTVKTFDPNDIGPYAVIFDSACTGWTKDPERNKAILLDCQAWANNKLQRKGVLLLNDVREMLGLEPTKAGMVIGWIYDLNNPNLQNHVDFGIWNVGCEATRRFVNGLEKNVILDFNVDGNVYEMLD